MQKLTVRSEQYRAHYLSADISQWRFALALFAVPNIGFMGFDYALFGWSPMFFNFVAVRLLLIAYSVALWFYLPRVKSATRADVLLIVWSVLGIAAVFANALAGRRTITGTTCSKCSRCWCSSPRFHCRPASSSRSPWCIWCLR